MWTSTYLRACAAGLVLAAGLFGCGGQPGVSFGDASAPATDDAANPLDGPNGIYLNPDSPYVTGQYLQDAGVDASLSDAAPSNPDAQGSVDATPPLSCAASEQACGGVCVSRDDLNNCGACGNACTTAIPNATPACTSGACTFTCANGYHACGSGSSATCASNSSPDSCGTSCSPCSTPQYATATCLASGGTYSCGFTCPSTRLACSSACVDAATDVDNCGGCGNTCTTTVAHGSPACSGGSCGVACDAGHHLCGSGASTTCADDTSPQSCGSSCTPCTAPANASATCSGSGSCGWACNSGFHACGSACADDTSVATCGSSCTPCTPPANATASCAPSGSTFACAWSCNGGFHACGAGCADDTSPQTCGTSCTPCTAPSGATATCTGSGAAATCGWSCNTGLSQCGNACLDLQTDANNCGACGHSCAPGTCSAGQCQPWKIAQSTVPNVATASSLATDGTYLAWFDTGGQRCQVVTFAAATSGPAAPTTFALGNPSTNVAPGYVAVANGVVACLLQGVNGPEVWFQSGTAGPVTPIYLTGADAGNISGLALNATGTAVYFNNTLSNGSGTTSVYTCNLASNYTCRSVGAYISTSPGGLLVSGNSVIVAEGQNGVVGALSLNDGSWSAVAQGQGTVDVLTADATNVYWVSGSFSLSRAPLANLAAGPQLVLPNVTGQALGLASDGTNLYVGGVLQNAGSASGGWIGSVPVGGAPAPTTVASLGSNIVYALTVASRTLFWSDLGDGYIMGLRL